MTRQQRTYILFQTASLTSNVSLLSHLTLQNAISLLSIIKNSKVDFSAALLTRPASYTHARHEIPSSGPDPV